ncbi:hypothetical protein [Jhaorihella thermophila]|uniref:Lipoprotein n=1 Tax=Jhaorihella thermophila TaxID=488547 RepID=A0A1H5S2R9_9RHOB|nr:hypothetical protein [Jhaorihella thermophila]SEF44916.1 hypothetical protein SAMN05421751_101310 [Jhaorihella thermophila]
MKTTAIPAVALLALAGCTDVTFYHKPGVAVGRAQTDTTDCEVEALQKAPVANQIRQEPPIYYPGRTVCDPSGNCWTTPGYWVEGGIYTVDVNRELRARVMDMCMAGKGYAPVTLPRCSPNVAASVPKRPTTTLPQLTPQSCVIRHDDGSWQIVSPVTASSQG